MDRFSQILYDLGQEIDTDLYSDANRICELNYNDEFSLQLQFDEIKNQLIIASSVAEVPAGKYREKLFETTLIYNSIYPRIGTFGYLEKENTLVFFDQKNAVDLTGKNLSQYLEIFIEEIKIWRDSIKGGRSLPISKPPKSPPSTPGIRL